MYRSILALTLAVILSACGGSDSDDDASNTDNPGTDSGVTRGSVATEAEDLSYIATQVSIRAVGAENSPPVFGSVPSAPGALQKVTGPVAMEVTSTTIDGDCGGSATIVSEDTSSGDALFPLESEQEITYNNFCLSLGDGTSMTFNGSVDIELFIDEDYSFFAFSYDLAFSSDNAFVGSGVIQASETCETFGDAAPICTSSSSYEYSDGNEYVLSDFEVSGDASSGYSFDGEVDGGDFDTFTISVSDITLCDNGNIGSGSITITEAEVGTVSVSFPNCDEMIVTYDGVSETLPQL